MADETATIEQPKKLDTSSIRLDRSRSHDVVFPPESGAHFYQDGLYFCHEGKVVEDMIDAHGEKAIRRKTARAAAKKAAEEAYAKALAEDGVDPEQIAIEVEKARETGSTDTGALDLVAWAKGEKKYQFFAVRKAFQEQHGKHINDRNDAIDWLVENGHLPEDFVG